MMASGLVTLIKFPKRQKVKLPQILHRLNELHKRLCHKQVPLIGIISFLKATTKFKTQLSAGKIMASCFGIQKKCVLFFFFPDAITINAHYYSNMLYTDVHQAIWKNRSGNLSKNIILLCDNL